MLLKTLNDGGYLLIGEGLLKEIIDGTGQRLHRTRFGSATLLQVGNNGRLLACRAQRSCDFDDLNLCHFAGTGRKNLPALQVCDHLLVIVPEPLAYYFSAASPQVRVVGLPFPSPRISLRQFWHRKFHHDPRSRWLRTLTAELFQTPTQA